ncbi:MAG: hypothetical protein ACLFT0_10395 [Spirulinaceae cyanobacterium]
MKEQQMIEKLLFLNTLRRGLWFFGISSWSFGIIDRSIAALADGFLSAIDIVQLFTASFFFVSWLFLKPTSKLNL